MTTFPEGWAGFGQARRISRLSLLALSCHLPKTWNVGPDLPPLDQMSLHRHLSPASHTPKPLVSKHLLLPTDPLASRTAPPTLPPSLLCHLPPLCPGPSELSWGLGSCRLAKNAPGIRIWGQRAPANAELAGLWEVQAVGVEAPWWGPGGAGWGVPWDVRGTVFHRKTFWRTVALQPNVWRYHFLALWAWAGSQPVRASVSP